MTSWKTRLWRSHFPYVLERYRAVDGAACWIVLNRDYKPIGCDTSKWAQYEEYQIGIRPKRGQERRWLTFLNKLKSNTTPHRWFYDDLSHPCVGAVARRRYMALLEEFAQLQVVFVALHQPAEELPE